MSQDLQLCQEPFDVLPLPFFPKSFLRFSVVLMLSEKLERTCIPFQIIIDIDASYATFFSQLPAIRAAIGSF